MSHIPATPLLHNCLSRTFNCYFSMWTNNSHDKRTNKPVFYAPRCAGKTQLALSIVQGLVMHPYQLCEERIVSELSWDQRFMWCVTNSRMCSKGYSQGCNKLCIQTGLAGCSKQQQTMRAGNARIHTLECSGCLNKTHEVTHAQLHMLLCVNAGDAIFSMMTARESCAAALRVVLSLYCSGVRNESFSKM